MPDLKTELRKLEALKFDDDGDTTVITLQPAVALPDDQQGGVSKRFFNMVLDNPGCNRKRLVKLAESANIGSSSSSSLLHQFTKRGLLRTVDSLSGLTYFCVGTQYTPGYIKHAGKIKKVLKVTPPKVTPPKAATAVPQDVSVHDLLNTMSITKARALYDELKKIFGTP